MDKPKRNIYLKMKTLQQAGEIWEGRTGALRTAEEQVQASSGLGRVTSRADNLPALSPALSRGGNGRLCCPRRDTYGASDTTPIRLRVGQNAHPVDTGDPLPDGADAVIMIEHVESVSHSEIEIRSAAFPWQHVRKVGEDIVAGELLLPQQHVLRPADVGSLLAAGILTVSVFARPQVFIQPTGSEIIPADRAAEAKPGEIVEFNGAILAGMVEECGGAPVLGGVVRRRIRLYEGGPAGRG